MNKKYVTIAIALIFIMALIGGSVAYFTAENTADNAVTASNVKVELVMLEPDGQGGTKAVSQTQNIVPGEFKERTAQIKNTGKEPAWVRLKVQAPGELALAQLDEKNWIKKDECWYYNKKLGAGETTTALFNGMGMDPDAGNESSGKNLKVKIEAQATQTVHNGESVLDAKGWPQSKQDSESESK